MVRRLIDQNARREQRRQALLMQRIEGPFEARLKRELTRAMRDMIDGYKLTGEVMQPRDHIENLTAIYQAMAIATFQAFGRRILEQGKAAGHALEAKRFADDSFAQIMTQLALRYISLEAIRARITAVSNTTRSQIIAAITRGFADGLGQAGIAGYISDLVPSLAGHRANLIARTETHGAANAGGNGAAIETGLRLRREWISAEDARTRPEHAEANGQIVGMGEPFSIGGESLMFPGDPSGTAEQVINCRCAVGFIVDD